MSTFCIDFKFIRLHIYSFQLNKESTCSLYQPPYFPDLVHWDFFLFPKSKSALKGRRFDIIDDIKTKTLQGISKEPF